jgi:HD-GYP domain-containing protein (c-di-GMP phosphodiesterase class II)
LRRSSTTSAKQEIPTSILDKSGRLTADEFAIVKQHPLIARDYLLQQGGFPADVISAITHHHELLDGSGYPHCAK